MKEKRGIRCDFLKGEKTCALGIAIAVPNGGMGPVIGIDHDVNH
jgi:hypothetical protein